jgi:hypothetical protein
MFFQIDDFLCEMSLIYVCIFMLFLAGYDMILILDLKKSISMICKWLNNKIFLKTVWGTNLTLLLAFGLFVFYIFFDSFLLFFFLRYGLSWSSYFRFSSARYFLYFWKFLLIIYIFLENYKLNLWFRIYFQSV